MAETFLDCVFVSENEDPNIVFDNKFWIFKKERGEKFVVEAEGYFYDDILVRYYFKIRDWRDGEMEIKPNPNNFIMYMSSINLQILADLTKRICEKMKEYDS